MAANSRVSAGLGRRTGNHRDALAVQIRELLELGVGPSEYAAAVDEDRQAEIDPLVTRERHGRRAALDVDPALGYRIEAVARFECDPVELQRREPELLLDRRCDARAQLDAVPAHSAVALLERKRRRAGAVTEMDDAVGSNAVERPRRAADRHAAANIRHAAIQTRKPSMRWRPDITFPSLSPWTPKRRRSNTPAGAIKCSMPARAIVAAVGVRIPIVRLRYNYLPGRRGETVFATAASSAHPPGEFSVTRLLLVLFVAASSMAPAAFAQRAPDTLAKIKAAGLDHRRVLRRFAALFVRRDQQSARRLLDRPVQARDRVDRPRDRRARPQGQLGRRHRAQPHRHGGQRQGGPRMRQHDGVADANERRRLQQPHLRRRRRFRRAHRLHDHGFPRLRGQDRSPSPQERPPKSASTPCSRTAASMPRS